MNRDTYRTIRNHFRVVDQRRLSDRENPNNHPLQNIFQGLLYLGDKSCAISISGKEISISKVKEKSKSKINKYRTFNLNNQHMKVGIFIR